MSLSESESCDLPGLPTSTAANNLKRVPQLPVANRVVIPNQLGQLSAELVARQGRVDVGVVLRRTGSGRGRVG